MAAVSAVLAVAPTGAGAFIGADKVVIPGSPPTLTPGAEKVVKTPGFVPELITKAKNFLGAGESSAAARVFQASKVLPALGAVTAFGVGAAIGSEICGVLGISGCWFHGSEAADPAPSPGGYFWQYQTAAGSHSPAFVWIWSNGSEYAGAVKGHGSVTGGECLTAINPPNGATNFNTWSPAELICSSGVVKAQRTLPMRYAMENRTLEYHGTDNPAIPNYSYTAPGDWGTKLAQELGKGGDETDRVGQFIASKVEGSEVGNPYALTVEIPDCDGLLYPACEDLLGERGLTPDRVTRTWETADPAKDPDEVLELDPAKATEVEKGTIVTVTTNPDEAGMPLIIPDPEPGETYGEYAARLNPSLTAERVDLDAAFIDPAKGPNEVVTTAPKPETRLDPSTTHKVDVQTNPSTAPVPPAGGWSPPPVTGIDMSPLSGIPSPCTVFPFGLFCWMGEAFAQFNTSGTCPNFAAPVAGTGSDFEVTMCGDTAEQIMGYLRPALLLAFIVGCGVMFAKGTKAIGPD